MQVCEERADCMSCLTEPGCGWCPSGDQCLQNDGECVDGQVGGVDFGLGFLGDYGAAKAFLVAGDADDVREVLTIARSSATAPLRYGERLSKLQAVGSLQLVHG